MSDPQRLMLQSLFNAALSAVDPLSVVPKYLPTKPKGRTIVVGAGKASARMALALEQHWDAPLKGLVVTRYGHDEPCKHVRVIQAGHPVPDEAGAKAAQEILQLVHGLNEDDLVIAMISGGGSSLLTAPIDGVSLADKREVTQALLVSGATISEINCVRKRLSAIKGGKLAQACGLARVHTLVISDVPGDDPSTVASGPTLPDTKMECDALEILQRYHITPPLRVYAALKLGLIINRAVPIGERDHQVVATAQMALDAAASKARSLGLNPLILGNAIEGEARHLGTMLAGIAQQITLHSQPVAAPAVLLSGGETTVTLQGTHRGRGGRNAEFLLAHALASKGQSNVWGLAADTDGIDGTETNAGAVFGPDSLERARALGLDGTKILSQNDAYSLFEGLGDLITTGPTRTNVNDFRATMVL